jgi:hypothetical protein
LDCAHRWIVVYVTDNHGRLDNAAKRHSEYPSLSRTDESLAGFTSEEGRTNHEEMHANPKEITEDMTAWRKEMKADREATEAYPEKMAANPTETEPES